MQDAPKVSVILPVYNMESCLQETMDSLISQSFGDWEMICINDGSSDSSLRILEEYSRDDSRIVVYDQDNFGQGAARNRGLDLATGEYVLLLDSDDIYTSDFIEKMYQRARQTDADIVICRALEVEDDTGRKKPAPYTAKIEQIPSKEVFSVADMEDCIFTAFVGWPWDKLYRRSFLEDMSLRFPDAPNSEDLYFVFLSLVKAKKISLIDEELIFHRVGRTGSVSNSRKEAPLAFYDVTCLLKDELKKDPQLYNRVSWGFLNWAFDYAIWNIESMKDKKTRTKMVEALMNGELKELEVQGHAKEFFALDPTDLFRLQSLFSECGINVQVDRTNNGLKHPWLKYPVAFLNECRINGFLSAFRKTFCKIFKRDDTKNNDAGDRGSIFLDFGR